MELKHIGVKRKSGRYEWGSGENPYQHEDFFIRARKLAEEGKNTEEIAEYFGLTANEYRSQWGKEQTPQQHDNANFYLRERRLEKEGKSLKERADEAGLPIRQYRSQMSVGRAAKKALEYQLAYKLKYEKGYSNTAAAKYMGIPEPTFRSLLSSVAKERNKVIQNTSEILKKEIENGAYIDIGKGAETYLGISPEKLAAAVMDLRNQGYTVENIQVRQVFGKNKTTVKVLCPPGTTKREIYLNVDKIQLPTEYTIDENGDVRGLRPIQNVSSDRIVINYAETGGKDKDGIIELRRGVEDLDLGNSRYAQVRIGVDGTHYLKGVAVYSDDLPDGVDIRFNTNKHSNVPKMDVLKTMENPNDKKNPFGAAIKAGGQNGAINIVNEEGDWGEWSKTLSSQFLSKQSTSLARKQLKLDKDLRAAEYSEILSLTNPTLRRYLLETFSENCDSAAVHLKAAALPRQASRVLIPITSLKDDEAYCPTYKHGEQVALVRYPHGGTFEIPICKINNVNKEGRSVIPNAKDAIGINANVASKLSGADFDGDTVLVIPLSSARVNAQKTLRGLENFDPKERYPERPGMKYMTKTGTQHEMGKISNLITDMTIQGADLSEIARAVRHSMVVIDAYKHKLDYESSFEDNRIADLKERYQGGKNRGAYTLISRASAEKHILERREVTNTKRMTKEEQEAYARGERIYENTNKTHRVYDKETGEVTYKPNMIKTTQMAEEKDARNLSSGETMENIYADYANSMKAMANAARVEMRNTPRAERSPSAAKTYAQEVAELNADLKLALMNLPRERKAQLLANSTIETLKKHNPELYTDKSKLKKVSTRALAEARAVTGAKRHPIKLTKRKWEAVQAGAISDTMFRELLPYIDETALREYAMPPSNIRGMSPAKLSKARAMLRNDKYTWEDVARMMGVSVSTLQRALKE